MQRCHLLLEQKSLSIGHANNTLIITVCYNSSIVYYLIVVLYIQYKKPATIIKLEGILQEAYSKAKASKDGDVDCSPS